MKRELLLCVVVYLATLVCAYRAQGQVILQPVVAQPQYAVIGWQPVVAPGYWLAVPRPTWVGNTLWGPRWYFVVEGRGSRVESQQGGVGSAEGGRPRASTVAAPRHQPVAGVP